MFRSIARALYRRGLHQVELGDVDGLLKRFDPQCAFTFVGDTPLGARLTDRDEIRMWFERFGRLLPDPSFEILRLTVDGPPWRQHVAAHVVIRATVADEPYTNQFAHFLTVRWGRVLEDVVLEDTQRWAAACARLVAAGVAEAGALPYVHPLPRPGDLAVTS